MDETHAMYMAQRAKGYRNSLIGAGVAIGGMLFAAVSTLYSKAPEPRPIEPTAIVESIDNKVENTHPGNQVPSGLPVGIAISALGAAAGIKYALDGCKADQKQFAYAVNH